ncbi:MAG: S41 family peptidase [Bacteroidota bacterium]|nr:S41 family peptidase [Bacteroidota bacterium]
MRNISFSKLLCLIILSFFINTQSKAQSFETQAIKFGRLLNIIESTYVDSTNLEKLTETAISEMMAKLDPHSVYIPRDEVKKMNEPLQGGFEGIGISFNIFQDTLLVVTTIPGGPSEKVGLIPGDRILFVDGKPTCGVKLQNSDVFKMLRGTKGTRVDLKVKRKNTKELLDFTIIRDVIPIYSVDASYLLNKETGYIKVNRFAETTTEEFDKALKELKKQNITNLVLDLRGNGGGLLNAATDMVDNFISDKKMIVYTQGIKSPRKDYRASSSGEFEQGKLIVLIDEGSASASEIVTGAIQDWDRGIVIGRRSFGKGLVQQPFLLNDGSMIRLTTAHYYTPSGRCIQKPYKNGINEYQEDLKKRYEDGELFHKDSVRFVDTLRYQTLINKRVVYGGGGIMPDIFVPLDTSSHYQYFNALIRKNVLFPYVINYIDKNRETIKQAYPDFPGFLKKFEISDAMIEEVASLGEKEGIKKDTESIKAISDDMKLQIKALVARDLFDQDKFYEVMNTKDKSIDKALELLKDKRAYEKILTKP